MELNRDSVPHSRHQSQANSQQQPKPATATQEKKSNPLQRSQTNVPQKQAIAKQDVSSNNSMIKKQATIQSKNGGRFDEDEDDGQDGFNAADNSMKMENSQIKLRGNNQLSDNSPGLKQQLDSEDRSFENVNLKGDKKSIKPRP